MEDVERGHRVCVLVDVGVPPVVLAEGFDLQEVEKAEKVVQAVLEGGTRETPAVFCFEREDGFAPVGCAA